MPRKKPGLYENIAAKRKRIAAGSGEKMRKPGTKGRPNRCCLQSSRQNRQKTQEIAMAAVANTAIDRYTNVIEFTGGTITAVDEWMEVPAHSGSYTFAATVTGGANFSLALEASFNGNGNWFTIDTSKTINSNGQYVYFYDGKVATKVRMRVASISSGTPSIVPHITVAYHG
jgi:hypothetical protein